MNQTPPNVFSLDNFTGPLHFLLQLIRKSEIDIRDIPIQQITRQYLEKLEKAVEEEIEAGTEFIDTAATLLWVKSRMLLPHPSPVSWEELSEEEADRALIERLVDYYQCKCLGKQLADRQEEGFFLRQPVQPGEKECSGLENLSLEDLAALFQKLISRLQSPELVTPGEKECSLEEKIDWLRLLLQEEGKIPMKRVLEEQKTREEMIVVFLAVLELMKMGEIRIVKISSGISLFSRHHETRDQLAAR